MTPVIEARQLSFRYSDQPAPLFNDLDLQIAAGEVVAIVGLSGAGKSTLCYCLSGIIPNLVRGELAGEVTICGLRTTSTQLPELVRHVGVVLQNPDTQLLMPTVEDEVAFGLENLCLPPAEIDTRIEEALRLVGMSHRRNAHPYHLSGGEKQRVVLAAALSMRPQGLVLDECFSQLDEAGREMLKRVVRQLADQGRAVLMVEHDWSNLDIADRVLVLKDRSLKPFRGVL